MSTEETVVDCTNQNVVTLYYYEYVADSLGTWNREWFLDHGEATKARDDRWKKLGSRDNSECGEYGDVGDVYDAQIELSAEGVLRFAQDYALADAG